MTTLHDNMQRAFENRNELLVNLHGEDTDTYRLFHGVNEGTPGLSIDRYGSLLLIQTYYEELDQAVVSEISDFYNDKYSTEFLVSYNDRSKKEKQHKTSEQQETIPEELKRVTYTKELGVKYAACGRHRGMDPLLFLDMRAGRRYIQANTENCSVLNLFAYTCGVGICAAASGASDVWNVDFAESSLNFGRMSAEFNELDPDKIKFLHEDAIPTMRQLGGLKVSGRARHKKYTRFEPHQFDLVYLDPPRWAKTPFGAVDIARDYQSLFKPSLLATKEGGRVFCTNHLPTIDQDEWLNLLQRCTVKAGRTVHDIEVIEPEGDFPSRDGRHPLKMAVVHV